MASPIKRQPLAVILSLALAIQALLVPLAEANIWSERRPVLDRHPVDRLIPTAGKVATTALFQKSLSSDSSVPPIIAGLSANAGRVTSIERAASETAPWVVLIQDVHQNPEAQTNIAKTIESMAAGRADEIVVGVEGAFGAFDFSDFRRFDRDIRVAVAKALLDTNLIAAPSYFGLTATDRLPAIEGIDHPEEYRANIEAYREAEPLRAAIAETLAAVERDLTERKRGTFNERLLAFDRVHAAYLKGAVPLGAYLEKLSGYVDSLPASVARFLDAHQIEKDLNFQRVEVERAKAVRWLTEKAAPAEIERLVSLASAYQAGSLSYAEFYGVVNALMERHGIGRSDVPAFHRYVAYVLLSDRINAEDLFQDLRDVEKRLISRLAQTDDERTLVRASRLAYLVDRLARFALVPEEWKELQELDRSLIAWDDAIADRLRPFAAFYEAADRRSLRFVEAIDGRDETPVLVVGGFHSPHVRGLLKARGYSVAVVQPTLTRLDGDDSEYLSIFSRETAPLDRMFAGRALYLAPYQTAAGGRFPGVDRVNAIVKGALTFVSTMRNRATPPAAVEDVRVTGEGGDTEVRVFAGDEDVVLSRGNGVVGDATVATTIDGLDVEVRIEAPRRFAAVLERTRGEAVHFFSMRKDRVTEFDVIVFAAATEWMSFYVNPFRFFAEHKRKSATEKVVLIGGMIGWIAAGAASGALAANAAIGLGLPPLVAYGASVFPYLFGHIFGQFVYEVVMLALETVLGRRVAVPAAPRSRFGIDKTDRGSETDDEWAFRKNLAAVENDFAEQHAATIRIDLASDERALRRAANRSDRVEPILEQRLKRAREISIRRLEERIGIVNRVRRFFFPNWYAALREDRIDEINEASQAMMDDFRLLVRSARLNPDRQIDAAIMVMSLFHFLLLQDEADLALPYVPHSLKHAKNVRRYVDQTIRNSSGVQAALTEAYGPAGHALANFAAWTHDIGYGTLIANKNAADELATAAMKQAGFKAGKGYHTRLGIVLANVPLTTDPAGATLLDRIDNVFGLRRRPAHARPEDSRNAREDFVIMIRDHGADKAHITEEGLPGTGHHKFREASTDQDILNALVRLADNLDATEDRVYSHHRSPFFLGLLRDLEREGKTSKQAVEIVKERFRNPVTQRAYRAAYVTYLRVRFTGLSRRAARRMADNEFSIILRNLDEFDETNFPHFGGLIPENGIQVRENANGQLEIIAEIDEANTAVPADVKTYQTKRMESAFSSIRINGKPVVVIRKEKQRSWTPDRTVNLKDHMDRLKVARQRQSDSNQAAILDALIAHGDHSVVPEDDDSNLYSSAIKVFGKGEKIIDRGRRGTDVYIVLKGNAVAVAPRGILGRLFGGAPGRIFPRLRERFSNRFPLVAGDLFGETALLNGGKRSADVVAMEPTVVLILKENEDERNFRKLLADPQFLVAYANIVARRGRERRSGVLETPAEEPFVPEIRPVRPSSFVQLGESRYTDYGYGESATRAALAAVVSEIGAGAGSAGELDDWADRFSAAMVANGAPVILDTHHGLAYDLDALGDALMEKDPLYVVEALIDLLVEMADIPRRNAFVAQLAQLVPRLDVDRVIARIEADAKARATERNARKSASERDEAEVSRSTLEEELTATIGRPFLSEDVREKFKTGEFSDLRDLVRARLVQTVTKGWIFDHLGRFHPVSNGDQNATRMLIAFIKETLRDQGFEKGLMFLKNRFAYVTSNKLADASLALSIIKDLEEIAGDWYAADGNESDPALILNRLDAVARMESYGIFDRAQPKTPDQQRALATAKALFEIYDAALKKYGNDLGSDRITLDPVDHREMVEEVVNAVSAENHSGALRDELAARFEARVESASGGIVRLNLADDGPLGRAFAVLDGTDIRAGPMATWVAASRTDAAKPGHVFGRFRGTDENGRPRFELIISLRSSRDGVVVNGARLTPEIIAQTLADFQADNFFGSTSAAATDGPQFLVRQGLVVAVDSLLFPEDVLQALRPLIPQEAKRPPPAPPVQTFALGAEGAEGGTFRHAQATNKNILSELSDQVKVEKISTIEEARERLEAMVEEKGFVVLDTMDGLGSDPKKTQVDPASLDGVVEALVANGLPKPDGFAEKNAVIRALADGVIFDHHAAFYDGDATPTPELDFGSTEQNEKHQGEVNTSMLVIRFIKKVLAEENFDVDKALARLKARFKRVTTDNLGDAGLALFIVSHLTPLVREYAADPDNPEAALNRLFRVAWVEDFGIFGSFIDRLVNGEVDGVSPEEVERWRRARDLDFAVLGRLESLLMQRGLFSDRHVRPDQTRDESAIITDVVDFIERVFSNEDAAARARETSRMAYERRVEDLRPQVRRAMVPRSELPDHPIWDDIVVFDGSKMPRGVFALWQAQAQAFSAAPIQLVLSPVGPDSDGNERYLMIFAVRNGRGLELLEEYGLSLADIGDALKAKNAEAQSYLADLPAIFGRPRLQVSFPPAASRLGLQETIDAIDIFANQKLTGLRAFKRRLSRFIARAPAAVKRVRDAIQRRIVHRRRVKRSQRAFTALSIDTRTELFAAEEKLSRSEQLKGLPRSLASSLLGDAKLFVDEAASAAEELAVEIGEMAYREQQRAAGSQSLKDDGTIVTDSDQAGHELFVRAIRSRFPGHKIISEEELRQRPVIANKGFVWIIDPIDGTRSYAEGGKDWGVMITLLYDGELVTGAIYAPGWNPLGGAGTLVSGRVGREGLRVNGRPFTAVDRGLRPDDVSPTAAVTNVDERLSAFETGSFISGQDIDGSLVFDRFRLRQDWRSVAVPLLRVMLGQALPESERLDVFHFDFGYRWDTIAALLARRVGLAVEDTRGANLEFGANENDWKRLPVVVGTPPDVRAARDVTTVNGFYEEVAPRWERRQQTTDATVRAAIAFFSFLRIPVNRPLLFGFTLAYEALQYLAIPLFFRAHKPRTAWEKFWVGAGIAFVWAAMITAGVYVGLTPGVLDGLTNPALRVAAAILAANVTAHAAWNLAFQDPALSSRNLRALQIIYQERRGRLDRTQAGEQLRALWPGAVPLGLEDARFDLVTTLRGRMASFSDVRNDYPLLAYLEAEPDAPVVAPSAAAQYYLGDDAQAVSYNVIVLSDETRRDRLQDEIARSLEGPVLNENVVTFHVVSDDVAPGDLAALRARFANRGVRILTRSDLRLSNLREAASDRTAELSGVTIQIDHRATVSASLYRRLSDLERNGDGIRVNYYLLAASLFNTPFAVPITLQDLSTYIRVQRLIATQA